MNNYLNATECEIKGSIPTIKNQKMNIEEKLTVNPDGIYSTLAKTRYNLFYLIGLKEELRIKLREGQQLPNFPEQEMIPNMSLFDLAQQLRDISDCLASELGQLVSEI